MSKRTRVISITNQKGGVSKTTTTHNVGSGLARLNRKVLLIDLDPQADLTEGCNLDPDDLGNKNRTIYDVLHGDVSLSDIIVELEAGLFLAPSCTDLTGAETEFIGRLDQFVRLKHSIATIAGYDYVLIDCPPSLGQLTLNALTAAKEVFIPITSEFRSFRALHNFYKTIKLVNGFSNKELMVTGVIAARYDSRKRLNRAIVEKMNDYFGDTLFRTKIRENVALAEAPAAKMNIFMYKGRSYGAEDYMALSNEIILMEEGRNGSK